MLLMGVGAVSLDRDFAGCPVLLRCSVPELSPICVISTVEAKFKKPAGAPTAGHTSPVVPRRGISCWAGFPVFTRAASGGRVTVYAKKKTVLPGHRLVGKTRVRCPWIRDVVLNPLRLRARRSVQPLDRKADRHGAANRGGEAGFLGPRSANFAARRLYRLVVTRRIKLGRLRASSARKKTHSDDD